MFVEFNIFVLTQLNSVLNIPKLNKMANILVQD